MSHLNPFLTGRDDEVDPVLPSAFNPLEGNQFQLSPGDVTSYTPDEAAALFAPKEIPLPKGHGEDWVWTDANKYTEGDEITLGRGPAVTDPSMGGGVVSVGDLDVFEAEPAREEKTGFSIMDWSIYPGMEPVESPTTRTETIPAVLAVKPSAKKVTRIERGAGPGGEDKVHFSFRKPRGRLVGDKSIMTDRDKYNKLDEITHGGVIGEVTEVKQVGDQDRVWYKTGADVSARTNMVTKIFDVDPGYGKGDVIDPTDAGLDKVRGWERHHVKVVEVMKEGLENRYFLQRLDPIPRVTDPREQAGRAGLRWITEATDSGAVEDFFMGMGKGIMSDTPQLFANLYEAIPPEWVVSSTVSKGFATRIEAHELRKRAIKNMREYAKKQDRLYQPLDPEGWMGDIGRTLMNVGIDMTVGAGTAGWGFALMAIGRVGFEPGNEILAMAEAGTLSPEFITEFDKDKDGVLNELELRQAMLSAGWRNIPAIVSEFLIDKLMFKSLFGARGQRGAFKSRKVRDVVSNLALVPAAEAVTEGFQTYWGNNIALNLLGYDSHRKLSDDVFRSMALGGIVGGTVSGIATISKYTSGTYTRMDSLEMIEETLARREEVAKGSVEEQVLLDIHNALIEDIRAQDTALAAATMEASDGELESAMGMPAFAPGKRIKEDRQSLTIEEVESAIAKQRARLGEDASEIVVLDDWNDDSQTIDKGLTRKNRETIRGQIEAGALYEGVYQKFRHNGRYVPPPR